MSTPGRTDDWRGPVLFHPPRMGAPPLAPDRVTHAAPRFPGVTFEVDVTGQIVGAWLGRAAPVMIAEGDMLAALEIDDATPDAARIQMLLASAVGAPVSAWALLASDAPTTVTQRRGHVLAVWWEPIAENGVITTIAVFAVRTTDAPIEVEDPVEINRICVDALALLDECEAGLRHLLADHSARHAVHRMFRAMHTIKGSTRGPRLQSISDLAHQTEEAIEILRHTGDLPVDVLTQIGEALKAIRAAVTAARPRGEVDDAMSDLLSACRPALVDLQLAIARLGDRDRDAVAIASRSIERIRVASARANMKSLSLQCVSAARAVDLIAGGAPLDPALLDEITTLDRQIELYATVYREIAASDAGPSLTLTMASWMDACDDRSGSFAGLGDVMSRAGVTSLLDAFADPDPLAMRRAIALLVDAPAMFEPGRPRDEATLRFERAQNELLGALAVLEHTPAGPMLGELRAITERLTWVPLTAVSRRLVRMTRTIGADLGKTVGAEVELGDLWVAPDIARVLGEILIHAVRNAVDHGIEPPEERIALGKDARGTIKVAAYAVDGRIVVTVRDDGRGVAIARVRQIAVARGLLAEGADVRDDALLDLLFHPGFSTASAVTSLSGRGVGMDVIRSLAEERGGRVALGSTPGRGAELTIDLPMSPGLP